MLGRVLHYALCPALGDGLPTRDLPGDEDPPRQAPAHEAGLGPQHQFPGLHAVEVARRECIGHRRIAELEQGVFSIDSTSVDLCLSVFPWAKFRARKVALKIHTVLENSSSLPVFAHVTEGKT